MRAKYVGPIATTFEQPVGTVAHGDEFDIPKGLEKSFLQHGHIEPADKPAKDFYIKMNKPAVPIPSVVPVPDSEPDSSTK